MNHERLETYQRCLKGNKHLALGSNYVEQSVADTFEADAWLVLAPALHSFVIWTLQQATKDGVKRLYFLARDGYLMHKIALEITEQLNLPIECRYLYCSRYSLRTPLFHLDVEEALDYICRNSIKVNLAVILKRTGLKKSQREEVIRQLELDISPEDEIPYKRLKEVRRRLSECKVFIQYLIENSKRLMPSLEAYLKQEGLLEEVEMAMVDSGWTGSTQKTLNQALLHLGRGKEIMGYYWGLYSIPAGEKWNQYCGYYFMPHKNMKEKVYFSNSLFEAIFSAPHGMTLGYRLSSGRAKPFFLSVREDTVAFQKKLERIMFSYTEMLVREIETIDDINTQETKAIHYPMLKLLMTNPTKEEVEYFGNLFFSDDVFEDEGQWIAAKFGEELRRNNILFRILILLGIRRGRMEESGWVEGSIVRHGVRTKSTLRQYTIYKWLRTLRARVRWK